MENKIIYRGFEILPDAFVEESMWNNGEYMGDGWIGFARRIKDGNGVSGACVWATKEAAIEEMKGKIDTYHDDPKMAEYCGFEGWDFERVVNTCFGDFEIRDDEGIAVFVGDDAYYYHIPRKGMTDKEIQDFFLEIQEIGD